jgi:hydrogenase-4 component E
MISIFVDNSIRFLLILIFISAIFIIRTRTLSSLIRLSQYQSFIVFIIAIFLFLIDYNIIYLIIALLTFFSKVLFIPWYINRIIERLKIKRDIKFDYLNPTYSTFLSLGVFIITYQILNSAFSELHLENVYPLGAIAGVSIAFMGLIVIFTRSLLISDIIGYLTMENGIVLVTLTVVDMPFIIEVLVILDILIFSLLTAILSLGIESTAEEYTYKHIFQRLTNRRLLKEEDENRVR